MSLLTE